MRQFVTDPASSSTGKVYSTIYVTVLCKRRAGWFVANIIVPSLLLLLVSWLTFTYETEGKI
jgi:hypothetical protein